jgi:hypothetical protein
MASLFIAALAALVAASATAAYYRGTIAAHAAVRLALRAKRAGRRARASRIARWHRKSALRRAEARGARKAKAQVRLRLGL